MIPVYKLGRGGKATFKKYGREHMSKIAKDGWVVRRRAAAKAKRIVARGGIEIRTPKNRKK